jgi:hypothetical protein
MELFYKNFKQMTQKDVATYYSNLSRGDKGRFTAFVSLRLGGSPHSWQHRLLCVARDTSIRPLSPVIVRELCAIIKSGSWRLGEEELVSQGKIVESE